MHFLNYLHHQNVAVQFSFLCLYLSLFRSTTTFVVVWCEQTYTLFPQPAFAKYADDLCVARGCPNIPRLLASRQVWHACAFVVHTLETVIFRRYATAYLPFEYFRLMRGAERRPPRWGISAAALPILYNIMCMYHAFVCLTEQRECHYKVICSIEHTQKHAADTDRPRDHKLIRNRSNSHAYFSQIHARERHTHTLHRAQEALCQLVLVRAYSPCTI